MRRRSIDFYVIVLVIVVRVCLFVCAVAVGSGQISDGPGVTLRSEDLAYAFGAPLVDGLAPFSASGFTRADRVFSELVLRYWTNFIKTGSVHVIYKNYIISRAEWRDVCRMIYSCLRQKVGFVYGKVLQNPT